jgi:hypothetical protein
MARALSLTVVAALLVTSCSVGGQGADPQRADPGPTAASSSPSPSKPPAPKVRTLIAVGDIACDPTSPVFDVPQYCRHEEVARLTHRLVADGADWFLPLGDLQYEDATLAKFNQVYDRWFGEFRSITEPIPGNHEYYTEGATGYFDYFGRRAGTPAKPWRSFSPVEGWRVLLLDSNCEFVEGCDPRSPQGRWLARELASQDETCTIAAWHHPLHTSGGYNGDEATIERAKPLWDAAAAGGVDIVLVGHDHIYERFAPIDDMRQFLVGTGGKELYEIGSAAPKSQVRFGDRTGVLELSLSSAGRYDYAFIDARNGRSVDSGSSRCTNDPKSRG